MNDVNLYDPFQNFDLVGAKCFITGIPVSKNIDMCSVFPKWLMESEDLYSKPFKLLDETYCTYEDLKLGVSKEIADKIETLNQKSKIAFDNSDSSIMNEVEWFQWASIIVYGLISAEIKNGLKSDEYKEEGFKVSPVLVNKFRTLHKLLQSINHDYVWDTPMPFSFISYKLNDDKNASKFEHRNEINTLTFSFRYKNLGIILCLLDNELNKQYHKELLSKWEGKVIDVIQFEELSARVYYSNYLLSIIPAFNFTKHKDSIYITNIDSTIGVRKIFEDWDEKTFGQVLEAFWKPWNYSRVEILKNPEKAMSFL